MCRAAIVVAACVLGLVAIAGATTCLVKPDGTGDFPTIQAAVDAAYGGDTILLASGTFHGAGNHGVNFSGKAITICSQAGVPDSCTIDCDGGFGGYEARGFLFMSGEGRSSVLRGVTIREGRSDEGGAIKCQNSSPTIRECTFYNNASLGHGGSIILRDSSPLIADCWFEWNGTNGRGGAIGAWNSAAEILRCTFIDNFTAGTGGAVSFSGTLDVTIEECTFVRNLADVGGGMFFQDATQPEVRSCVVAFSLEGGAIRLEFPADPTISCCDLYGNAGGDWAGWIAGDEGTQGNFSADPCFCGAEAGDFHLWNYSPCNQAGLCGLIGAWPVGCTEPQALGPTDSDGTMLARIECIPSPATTEAEFLYGGPATGAGNPVLRVVDSTGRLVRTLAHGAGAGRVGTARWDLRDTAGRPVPAGTYFARLMVDGQPRSATRLLVIR
jgi:hypothetical protein